MCPTKRRVVVLGYHQGEKIRTGNPFGMATTIHFQLSDTHPKEYQKHPPTISGGWGLID